MTAFPHQDVLYLKNNLSPATKKECSKNKAAAHSIIVL